MKLAWNCFGQKSERLLLRSLIHSSGMGRRLPQNCIDVLKEDAGLAFQELEKSNGG